MKEVVSINIELLTGYRISLNAYVSATD